MGKKSKKEDKKNDYDLLLEENERLRKRILQLQNKIRRLEGNNGIRQKGKKTKINASI